MLLIVELSEIIMRLSPQLKLSHYGSEGRFLFLVRVVLYESKWMLCLIGSILVHSSDSFSVLCFLMSIKVRVSFANIGFSHLLRDKNIDMLRKINSESKYILGICTIHGWFINGQLGSLRDVQ